MTTQKEKEKNNKKKKDEDFHRFKKGRNKKEADSATEALNQSRNAHYSEGGSFWSFSCRTRRGYPRLFSTERLKSAIHDISTRSLPWRPLEGVRRLHNPIKTSIPQSTYLQRRPCHNSHNHLPSEDQGSPCLQSHRGPKHLVQPQQRPCNRVAAAINYPDLVDSQIPPFLRSTMKKEPTACQKEAMSSLLQLGLQLGQQLRWLQQQFSVATTNAMDDNTI